MGFTGTFLDSIRAAGAAGSDVLSASQAVASDEKIDIDVDLADSLTAHPINIGIASTTKLKGLMLQNAGPGDITAIKIDSGSDSLPLKSGACITLGEAALAKALVDLLSGATTFLILKVSTGGTGTRLQGVVLADS
jgi:hypothetical protein